MQLRNGAHAGHGALAARAARVPARPAQLDAGEHDVRLAGERYVLIGGVPLDEGSTNDRADIPEPTPRQRDVLVELCRPFFEPPGRARGAGEQRRDRVQPGRRRSARSA